MKEAGQRRRAVDRRRFQRFKQPKQQLVVAPRRVVPDIECRGLANLGERVAQIGPQHRLGLAEAQRAAQRLLDAAQAPATHARRA